MDFAERLDKHLTERKISNYKMAQDTDISDSLIGYWRRGKMKPTIDKLITISKYLEVSLDYLLLGKESSDFPNHPTELSYDEEKLLNTFRQLDEPRQYYVLGNVSRELGKQRQREQWEKEHPGVIEEFLKKSFPEKTDDNVSYVNFEDDLPADRKDIAVFFQPAAAGTGAFLDSDDYDMVDVPIDPITIRASFGVRVSGDSMEPDFEDEDIVFVKQQRTVDSGEIGVFVLNGDAFIKKLMKIKSKYQLVSLNSKYKPIDIHADDEFRVVGKVIGKLEE